MVLLKSEKIKLGTRASDFQLTAVDGKRFSLSDFSSSQILIILFICNHCPYVKAIEDRILDLAKYFRDKSVQFVGICSNDPTDYPDDAPASLLARWKEKNYGFPYLIDETQHVAKMYGAVCTPDIFVYGKDRCLAYHGQLDDNWQDSCKVTRQSLKDAVGQLLAGQAVSSNQVPSMGCSIKWRQS